jgi:hypothetical protein
MLGIWLDPPLSREMCKSLRVDLNDFNNPPRTPGLYAADRTI